MKTCTMHTKSAMKPQAGFTLIELLIGMAIIGILLAVVFGQAGILGSKADSKGDVDGINALIQNIKDGYGTGKSYATLTNTVILDSNWAPENMNTAKPSTINLSNGSAVTFQPSSLYYNQSGDAFDITIAGYASDACAAFVQKTAGQVFNATINGTTVKSKPVGQPVGKLDEAAVVSSCSAGGTGVANIVLTAH